MPVYPVVKLTPAQLDDESLLAVGRIVRAFAEIEDMITLFICNLAQISESNVMVLLGRTPVSTKLTIALYLAKMRSDDALATYKRVFNDGFTQAMACRNAVTHGVLLGTNPDGLYAFLTAKTADPIGGAAVQYVQCYGKKTLQKTAEMLELAIPYVEGELKLEALRKRRNKLSPQLHPEDQNRRKSRAKRQPPPPPSGA